MLRTPTASNVDRSLQAMEHHDNASATCVQKDNMHDYFKQNYVDGGSNSLLPDTPCSSPVGKVRRTDKVTLDAASISTQLAKLFQLVKNRSDRLEKLIGENSDEEIGRNTEQISGVMETIELISSEVKYLK